MVEIDKLEDLKARLGSASVMTRQADQRSESLRHPDDYDEADLLPRPF